MNDDPPTIEAQLQVAGRSHDADWATPTVEDPVALLRHLEESNRFHRDAGLGSIYHVGSVSLRENVALNSLHIIVEGNRIAAHVDLVSPLGLQEGGPSRYSLRRATAHNLVGMFQDLLLLLRGRHGDHRCELDCEWVAGESRHPADHDDLLDPQLTAWSVQMEARVAGSLDESRLRAALVSTVGLSPTHDPLEVVDCADDTAVAAARVALQSRPVAVTEVPPLRALLARHPAGDVVMLNVNHAAADGFDSARVLQTIAAAYAAEAGSGVLDFLVDDDLPVRPASAAVPPWKEWSRKATVGVRDLLARPARLAPDGASDEPGYGFHLVSLSEEDSRGIVAAHDRHNSRNVHMAALHLAIGEWNLQHGSPGRRVGVLAPVNLRPPEWDGRRVANLSVTARVSTNRRHRAGPASALRSITAQTSRNKGTRTGIALIAALERTGLLALWAKQSVVVLQPLTRNRDLDIALLANIGWLDEPPRFGPEAGETTEVWFSAPARAPLSLCIGVVAVDGRPRLTLRYPHRLFSEDAARRFADLYLAQLTAVAAEDGVGKREPEIKKRFSLRSRA